MFFKSDVQEIDKSIDLALGWRNSLGRTLNGALEIKWKAILEKKDCNRSARNSSQNPWCVQSRIQQRMLVGLDPGF
jgi:hypothetical protein